MAGFLSQIAPIIQKNWAADKATDQVKHDIFKKQDLLDIDADLYIPEYKRSPALKNERDSMLTLFNARKDQILSARRTPGINQMRF